VVILGTGQERNKPFQAGDRQSSLLCGWELLEEWWKKGGSASTSRGGGQWASLSRGIGHNSPLPSFGNHNVSACMRTTNRFLKMKIMHQKGDRGEKQGLYSIRFDVSHCFSRWTQLSAAACGKLQTWKGV